MFGPRQIEDRQRLSTKQRIVVFGMNVCLLSALTVAMYLGQQTPGNLTIVFLKTFIPLAVVILVTARILLRKLQPPEPEHEPETQTVAGCKN